MVGFSYFIDKDRDWRSERLKQLWNLIKAGQELTGFVIMELPLNPVLLVATYKKRQFVNFVSALFYPMIQIQNSHSFQTPPNKETKVLSRRLTRIFDKFKSDTLESQNHTIDPFNGNKKIVTHRSTDDLYFDEDFAESVSTLYRDSFITLHEDHISIHNYHVPTTRLKEIHYRDISHVYSSQELRLPNSRCKVWGSSSTGIWWAFDKRRSMLYRHKYDTIVLILHNSKRIGVSIKDSNQIGLIRRLVQEANDTPVLIE
ncbi:hypothetical protein K7432_013523 [Basidiobolus ranarum]|uniref:Uncharacterized protein n=1 Tax=Basidiobolus ranarum TaxID=34480 RepID=A0ABR2WJ32_9FUNG